MVCSAKKTFLRFAPELLLLSVLIGCSTPAPESGEEAVRAVLDMQVDAWNDGDIETYMTGYWQSDSTIFVSGGSRFSGYDSVLARYRRSYPDRGAMGHLTFEELEIIQLSSEAALARGIWRLDRANDEPWGRFSLLFEKKPEGWRIVYDHTSSAS